eukprot:s3924_g8.t1
MQHGALKLQGSQHVASDAFGRRTARWPKLYFARNCWLSSAPRLRSCRCCCAVSSMPEDRRYPELGRLDVKKLDLVLLSHFHLDHAGALPYLTEVLGYHGPLLMTHPTRAIAPIILQEYLQIRYRAREETRYTAEMIDACFARAQCLQLQERVNVGDQIAVTSYYAGHVLGAVMFLIEAGGSSVLYTGDFTTVPDHHLSAARLPLGLRPDLMITESTCCTTVRSSKRMKEYELCCKVQECLEKGGKVLVPLLMMGRSQEICMILEEHWSRTSLAYPIFVIKGSAQKARVLFQLFSSWGSQKVRASEKPFEFPHVRFVDLDEILGWTKPAVMLAGPAMMEGGASLQIFKSMAPESKNLVVIPGYCLPGTVGNLVQAKSKKIQLKDEVVHVKCEVETVVHSDHTDSRGILELISQVSPQQVVLVHGAESLMKTFQPIVKKRLRVPCFSPSVGETVELTAPPAVQASASTALLLDGEVVPPPPVLGSLPAMHGATPFAATFSGLLRKRGRDVFELHPRSEEGLEQCGLKAHRVRFSHQCMVSPAVFQEAWSLLDPESSALAGSHTDSKPLEMDSNGVSCTVSREAEHMNVSVLWDREADKDANVCSFLKALGAVQHLFAISSELKALPQAAVLSLQLEIEGGEGLHMRHMYLGQGPKHRSPASPGFKLLQSDGH